MLKSEKLKDCIAQANAFLNNEKFRSYIITREVWEACLLKWQNELDAIQNGKQPDTEEPNGK